jgi:uncharacterized membrane protein YciS (DUF1049 family)
MELVLWIIAILLAIIVAKLSVVARWVFAVAFTFMVAVGLWYALGATLFTVVLGALFVLGALIRVATSSKFQARPRAMPYRKSEHETL